MLSIVRNMFYYNRNEYYYIKKRGLHYVWTYPAVKKEISKNRILDDSCILNSIQNRCEGQV